MDLFGAQSAAVITAVLALLALAAAVALWLLMARAGTKGQALSQQRPQVLRVRHTIETDGAHRAGIAREMSARAPPGDFHRAGPSEPGFPPRE